jgi:hypothetical protein
LLIASNSDGPACADSGSFGLPPPFFGAAAPTADASPADGAGADLPPFFGAAAAADGAGAGAGPFIGGAAADAAAGSSAAAVLARARLGAFGIFTRRAVAAR